MKYMFISDVHGNIEGLKKCIMIFNKIEADKLVLLGDTSGSYYDDTNEQIAQLLNDMKDKIEVIRGNCDPQDFEDMLDFEIFDDDMLFIKRKRYEKVDDFTLINGKKIESTSMSEWFKKEEQEEKDLSKPYITISITHGNYFNYSHLPPNCGDVFIQGHTHIPQLIKSQGRILANPGSIGKPRAESLSCYVLVDEDSIRLITLDGTLINEIKFNDGFYISIP